VSLPAGVPEALICRRGRLAEPELRLCAGSDFDRCAKKIIIRVGNYRYGDTGLYSEQWSSTAKGLLRTQKHYKWDEGKHTYALAGEVVTEERRVN
jgi:hypothetical protein